MKLTSLIIMGIIMLAAVILGSGVFILSSQLHQSKMTEALLMEAIPTTHGLEHFLNVINEDDKLLMEYLDARNTDEARKVEEQLHRSSETCELLAGEVERQLTLIDASEHAQEQYNMAMLVYRSLEQSRDTLIELHKEELAMGVRKLSEEQQARERYESLKTEASAHFVESLALMQERVLTLQEEVIVGQQKTTNMFIGVLVVFIILGVIGAFVLSRMLAHPLKHITRSIDSFSDGDWDSKVTEDAPVDEVQTVQNSLNKLFSIVGKQAKKNDKESMKVKQALLRPQYATVFEFIRTQNELGREVTIKDIKKGLHLTHPTVKERLVHLEKQGLLSLEKKGRQKIIRLS